MLVLGVALLAGLSLNAQEVQVPETELSVYMKGPFSRINFGMDQGGEDKNRFGLGVGVQFAKYLSYDWSVSAAVEYQAYRTEAVFTNLSDSYATIDMEGENFEFRYSANMLIERQRASYVNIPIRVQYEKGNLNNKFYASTGLAIGLPIGSSYKSRVYGLSTSGYYPQWDALLETPKFAGFGSWGNQVSGKQELKLKTSYSFLLEAGLKHYMRARQNLYVGVFADLPLNKIYKRDKKEPSLVAYNEDAPTQFIYNSVLDAVPGGQGKGYAEDVKTIALGIKLRYSFDL